MIATEGHKGIHDIVTASDVPEHAAYFSFHCRVPSIIHRAATLRYKIISLRTFNPSGDTAPNEKSGQMDRY
jgi:hypothetical protein